MQNGRERTKANVATEEERRKKEKNCSANWVISEECC
jgi:hypothetical protein